MKKPPDWGAFFCSKISSILGLKQCTEVHTDLREKLLEFMLYFFVQNSCWLREMVFFVAILTYD